ncbi:unnamed protein product, partial [Urochloa humidicola]
RYGGTNRSKGGENHSAIRMRSSAWACGRGGAHPRLARVGAAVRPDGRMRARPQRREVGAASTAGGATRGGAPRRPDAGAAPMAGGRCGLCGRRRDKTRSAARRPEARAARGAFHPNRQAQPGAGGRPPENQKAEDVCVNFFYSCVRV